MPSSFRPSFAEVEIHGRWLIGAGGALEVRLRFEAVAGDEAGREAAHGSVERLRLLVVAHALDGDAVLRPFELRLQGEEVRVRLQVGIALGDGDEARHGAP